jgi:hypothetical protein
MSDPDFLRRTKLFEARFFLKMRESNMTYKQLLQWIEVCETVFWEPSALFLVFIQVCLITVTIGDCHLQRVGVCKKVRPRFLRLS